MRILLIYPSVLDRNNMPKKYRLAFLPPLSLATLAALTPRLHEVVVVNDAVEEVDYDTSWDMVGLTAMSSQAPRAYQIAYEFRKRRIPVVMGGFHASMMPDEAAQHVDSVMVGEAEELWIDLLDDAINSSLKPLYKASNRPDLSVAVAPRWDCMNMKIYPRRLGARLPMMPTFTTRGCPYGCSFCAVTKYSGKTYRTRPIADVVDEVRKTPAKEFFFVDDNIVCNPEYSRDLFMQLTPLNIRWMSQISTNVLKTPELLDLAGRSGCFYLFVGIESLNKESLASVNKNFNKVEMYEELIARMRSAGIVPFLSFIFGFETDTSDQFDLTLEFLNRNRVGLAAFWILTPLPGTDIFDQMSQQGQILDYNWSHYDGTHVLFQPRRADVNELKNQYWEAYSKFHSLGGAFKNITRNLAVSRHPMEELFRTCFYQPYFWKKIRSREHPFSGGLGRLI